MLEDHRAQGKPDTKRRWAFNSRFMIGKPGNPMMERWRLVQTPLFGVYVHFIHVPELGRRRLPVRGVRLRARPASTIWHVHGHRRSRRVGGVVRMTCNRPHLLHKWSGWKPELLAIEPGALARWLDPRSTVTRVAGTSRTCERCGHEQLREPDTK